MGNHKSMLALTSPSFIKSQDATLSTEPSQGAVVGELPVLKGKGPRGQRGNTKGKKQAGSGSFKVPLKDDRDSIISKGVCAKPQSEFWRMLVSGNPSELNARVTKALSGDDLSTFWENYDSAKKFWLCAACDASTGEQGQLGLLECNLCGARQHVECVGVEKVPFDGEDFTCAGCS